MLPWSAHLAGRIDHRMIDSKVLRDNPLGGPYEKFLADFRSRIPGTRPSDLERSSPRSGNAGPRGIEYRYPLAITWLGEILAT